MKYLRYLALIPTLLVLAALTGCETLTASVPTTEQFVLRAAVRQGTLRYIDAAGDAAAQAARAKRVRETTQSVLSRFEGQVATVDVLQAFILSTLPADLSLADRQLILEVVDAVMLAVRAEVESNELAGDARVVLERLGNWVIAATNLVPQPES